MLVTLFNIFAPEAYRPKKVKASQYACASSAVAVASFPAGTPNFSAALEAVSIMP